MKELNETNLNAVFSRNDGQSFAEFEFEQHLNKWAGHVVSREFRGLTVPERQKIVWDILRTEFGEGSQLVSLVLTYTPEEWDETAESA